MCQVTGVIDVHCMSSGVRSVPVDVHRRHHQHRPLHGHHGPHQQEPRTSPRQDHDRHRVDSQRRLQCAAGARSLPHPDQLPRTRLLSSNESVPKNYNK